MTAFDQAWDLAKMPLVPGSIRYDGPHDVLNNEDILNEPPHNYSAEFHDPVEDRKIPMNARYYPANDNAEAFIRVSLEDEDSWPEEQPRMSSSATAEAWEPYISSSPHGYQRDEEQEWSGHIGPVYPQRRGKGTALYDMLAAILNDRVSGKLFPTTAPTTSAAALWRAKTGSLSEARERGWPVPDEPIR